MSALRPVYPLISDIAWPDSLFVPADERLLHSHRSMYTLLPCQTGRRQSGRVGMRSHSRRWLNYGALSGQLISFQSCRRDLPATIIKLISHAMAI